MGRWCAREAPVQRACSPALTGRAAVPFTLLLWGHCLFVAPWVLKLRGNFLFSYWARPRWPHTQADRVRRRPLHQQLTQAVQVGLLAAFGGGTVSALLIMDPSKAQIALFAVRPEQLVSCRRSCCSREACSSAIADGQDRPALAVAEACAAAAGQPRGRRVDPRLVAGAPAAAHVPC